MPDPENAPENAAETPPSSSATRRPATSWSRWCARLEQGGTTLAESLTLWERGEELARICQTALDGARERLDAVLGDDERDQPVARTVPELSVAAKLRTVAGGAEPPTSTDS